MARSSGKPKKLPPILKGTKNKPVTLIDSSENEEMSDDQGTHGGKNSRDNSSISSSSSSSSDSTSDSDDYSNDDEVTDKRRSKMKTVIVKRTIRVPKKCSRRETQEYIASDLKRTSRSFLSLIHI